MLYVMEVTMGVICRDGEDFEGGRLWPRGKARGSEPGLADSVGPLSGGNLISNL
jgi:hypothetical protein